MGIDLSFGGSAFPRALEVRQKLYDIGAAGTTTRYRELDRLDAHYRCCEYEHLQADWNGYSADQCEVISPKAVLPFGFTQPDDKLRIPQKRPSAPQRLTKLIVDRFTDMLFGEGRRPRVKVEDDPVADDFVQAVFSKAHFWREMCQARTYGGSVRSTLVTVGLKRDHHDGVGRFVVKAHSGKMIHDVVWSDADAKILAGVLIQYTFEREIEVLDSKTGAPTGKVVPQTYLYRRIIDEEMDIVFKPKPIVNGRMPDLEVDPHLSYRHELGYFPGVWIQNLPNSDDLDGVADCDGAFQMFQTIDQQVSQQNKALIYNQDPTLVISRDPKLDKMGMPIRKGSENALDVGMGGSANYLEMTGGAQAASAQFVKDQKQAAFDLCAVVLADPMQVSSAAASAVAIKLMYQPMLNKTDRMRDQYGAAIVDLARIILRFARKFARPIEYAGVAKPVFDLDPRIEERDPDPMNPDVPSERVYVERSPGVGSIIGLKWGPYFDLTPTDVANLISSLSGAVSANLLDLETAIQFAAQAYGIEDVEGLKRRVLDQIQRNKEEQAAMLGGGYGDTLGGMPPDAVPDETQPDAGVVEEEKEPLAGIQMDKAMSILMNVAMRVYPREEGISQLMIFLRLSQEEAETLMGRFGESIFLSPEQVALMSLVEGGGGGGGPPSGPPGGPPPNRGGSPSSSPPV